MTGTVTFTQTNGRGKTTPPQAFKIPITLPKSTQRVITFKNYCPFNVWFGASSASAPAKNKNAIACTSDAQCAAYTFSSCVKGFCGGGACRADADCVNTHAGTCAVPAGGSSAACTYCDNDNDCITGAQCNTTNHLCFWTIPAPKNAAQKHYRLNPYKKDGKPASNRLVLPDHSSVNGYTLLWSGGFGGRTGCKFAQNKLTCKTANCNTNGIGNGHGGCQLGESFEAPSTLAEATFVGRTPDTYDITIINGITIPVAMYPSGNSKGTPQTYNNPYLCAKAGSPTKIATNAGTVGGCGWSFSPSSVAFRWVDTDNNTQCAQDTDCQAINSKFRCGLTLTSIENNSAQTTCGTPLGYWNQNEVCAKNEQYSQANIVDCTEANIGGAGNSIINLLRCTGGAAVSCYNVSTANDTCCGCTNWQKQGVIVPTQASIVEQCQYPNSNWGAGSSKQANLSGSVLPGLVWLKQGCPSAYVYPYDDKASTFTCPSNNGQSAVNYTIEFCPGGKTAGLADEEALS
ncbi:thaumatin family protein [Legionella nagasakiensis]|uniref:thaumatin family protein n=1 Tax=Legionella nagasakiensis TaxID=535290 RepID=UPI0013EF6FA0|nr:thaumatin family protein [Legionella nagasakiensis]